MRWLVIVLGISVLCPRGSGASDSLRTEVAMGTYRLENSKARGVGTGFVVDRRVSSDEKRKELLLVTAAHVLQKTEGNHVQLILHEQSETDQWVAAPLELKIRQDEKSLWHQHPKLDVAVMRLPESTKLVDPIPLDKLADGDDWREAPPEPGELVRCVGFPHAAQFKPNQAGFPLTRLGCVASYPLLPFKHHATFLVDCNLFEGDSGGPIYIESRRDGGMRNKIIGLVQGQHFLDERYDLIYQDGHIRKRLGIAIVINSQGIWETIRALPDSGDTQPQ
ncbi:MAG: S1 family peptidase [Planctomycetota bacterium]